jgi:hypothetical protein
LKLWKQNIQHEMYIKQEIMVRYHSLKAVFIVKKVEK